MKNKKRLPRINKEYRESEEMLRSIGNVPLITIFGSASTEPFKKFYRHAEDIAERCAWENWGVITGGGPGIMEAGNKGCYRMGGISVGLGIKLPNETTNNEFISHEYTFKYFFTRKLMMTKFSKGFVIMPGGFGTMDELFEIITLKQTGKMPPRPIILYGKEFWGGLVEWIRNTLLSYGNIKECDISHFVVLDTPEEVVNYLRISMNKPKVKKTTKPCFHCGEMVEFTHMRKDLPVYYGKGGTLKDVEVCCCKVCGGIIETPPKVTEKINKEMRRIDDAEYT